jgi:hypothetical protein
MVNSFQSAGNPRIAERRCCWRERVLFPPAELGDDRQATVLNISQNGLALHTVTELIDDELPKIRFRFSVQAKGRVAWRTDSKKEAGIEFVDLSDEVRDQIQAWIFWTSGTIGTSCEKAEHSERVKIRSKFTIPVLIPETLDLTPENRSHCSLFTVGRSPAEAQGGRTALNNAEVKNTARGFGNALPLVGFSVAAAFFLSTFLPLTYHLQKIWGNQKASEVTLVPKQHAVSSASSAIAPATPEPSLELASFVLQVGAMVHEENAYKLASRYAK